jgi:putative phage-type endonuclease
MKTIDIAQNSTEWLAMRRNKIGASDAPSILGCGYKTPYQLYLEKLGLYDQPQSDLMRRGQELEPLARQKFVEMVGIEVEPMVVQHDHREWQIASLDGISRDRKVFVEIKTGGEASLNRAKEKKISDTHYCQVQHQLEVTGLEKCFYFFFDGQDGYPLEIYRDDNYIVKLNEAEKVFFEGLQDFIPPAMGQKDYESHETPQRLKLAEQWLEANKLASEWEKREKELREALIEECGGRNTIGGGVKIMVSARAGNIDYKSIPELHLVNLDQYRKAPTKFYRVVKG